MTKKLRDIEIDEFLYDCIHVDPIVIQEEFARVAPDLAYWSAKFAEAHKTYLEAKILRDNVRGAKWFIVKNDLLATRGKCSNPDVEAALDTDEDMNEALASLVEAEYERERLKGVLEAVRAKKDMLISMGAMIRAEMQGDPVIRDQSRLSKETRG